MTASPVWNVKDVPGSLAALEANLDSKVVAVRNHADELAVYAPKASEVSLAPLSPRCFNSLNHCLADQTISFPSTGLRLPFAHTLDVSQCFQEHILPIEHGLG
jgi:hypothetical protein